ncbi:transposable element Tcb1 transposase [Trichonephila clavipes]|nr:transposable element Tcb1 transposase [Trichonephila clavipes]
MSQLDAGGYDGLTWSIASSSVHHFSVYAHHSTPFTAEWSVHMTSIAWSTLDAEPQTSLPPMLFVNHLIELLPLARSPDISPIENMWFIVAQRLIQITPPAATPDQRWQCVEAAWSAVPPKHIQSLFESMP